MTTKQALQYFFIEVIVGIPVFIAALSFKMETPRYEWVIYIQYFGIGIIAGYLWAKTIREAKDFFDLK